MIPKNIFREPARGANPESLFVEVTNTHNLYEGTSYFYSLIIESGPFLAQSKALDGAQTQNEVIESKVDCSTEGVTCFTETASIINKTAVDKVDTYLQNYVETISEFLARPVLLDTISFSTSNPVDTTLFSVLSIGTLLDSTSVWTDKLSGYGLMKGTFVVRIEVNASPFQQGSALLHYVPCYGMYPNAPKRFNLNQVQKLQHPHVLFTTADTAIEMEIPFITPEDYYRLQGKSFNPCDWGAFFVDVFSPLRVGSTATQTSCNLQVYGYWKDLSLSAPMIAQSSGKISRGKATINKELAPSGRVGPALMSIGTGLSSLSDIPMIGSFMTPLSWIARATGAVASAFGYSKPSVDTTQCIMANQPNRYVGLSDGPDTSVQLGVSHDNRLKLNDSRSMNGQDEMSYSYLLKTIPNFRTVCTWSASNVPDQVVYSEAITPGNFYGAEQGISGTAHSTLVRYGGPLFYLANVHELYRGSIKVNIRIVKTNFHSGKLLIVYTPTSGAYTAPTISNSALSIRQVVDIRELGEITLTLPYMAASEYLNVHNATGLSETIMGQLSVIVLNQLRNPETVSDIVDLIVTYTAGDDFEFALPCAPSYGQDIEHAIPWGLPCELDEELVAQSSGTIVDAGIGDTKQMTRGNRNSENCIGETVSSIKQLINRYSFSNSDITTVTNPEFYPWYMSIATIDYTTGSVGAPNPSIDALSYFAPMYLFCRGSVRMLYAPLGIVANQTLVWGALTTTNQSNTSTLIKYVIAGHGNPGGFQQPLNLYTDFRNQIINSVTVNTLTDGYCHLRVPYQSRYPVALVNMGKYNSMSTTGYEPSTRLCLNRSLGTAPLGSGVGRSAGEDFQFLYFINCPGLIVYSDPV